jgi:hypothetical protein
MRCTLLCWFDTDDPPPLPETLTDFFYESTNQMIWITTNNWPTHGFRWLTPAMFRELPEFLQHAQATTYIVTLHAFFTNIFSDVYVIRLLSPTTTLHEFYLWIHCQVELYKPWKELKVRIKYPRDGDVKCFQRFLPKLDEILRNSIKGTRTKKGSSWNAPSSSHYGVVAYIYIICILFNRWSCIVSDPRIQYGVKENLSVIDQKGWRTFAYMQMMFDCIAHKNSLTLSQHPRNDAFFRLLMSQKKVVITL